MSLKSRARKQERVITITTDGQEPNTLRINTKTPAVAAIFSLPDTPNRIRARAALNAAKRELEALTPEKRGRALAEFGFYELTVDADAEYMTLPTGQTIGYTKDLKENPAEFNRMLGELLLAAQQPEE